MVFKNKGSPLKEGFLYFIKVISYEKRNKNSESYMCGCANTIKTTLAGIENIEELEVDIASFQLVFNYRDEASIGSYEQKLTDLGYPPVGAKNNVISKAKSMIR